MRYQSEPGTEIRETETYPWHFKRESEQLAWFGSDDVECANISLVAVD